MLSKTIRHRYLAFLITSFSLSVISMASNAASIEEIVIQSTLNQDTPTDFIGSASVLSDFDALARNAQNIDQLLATVPSANFSGGASRGRFVQIRGIGDIEQFVDPKAYPSVGLVIDGIELNGLFGAGLLFDAEQIEVLRGPQGTRLGSSALAGSINIISADPSEEYDGYLEAGIGKFEAWQVGAVFNGALAENIKARFAVQQYNSNGYISNNFLASDTTGEFDEITAKAKLQWRLNNDNTLGLTLLHVNNDNGYDAFSLENVSNTTFSNEPGRDEQEIYAIAINSINQIADKLSLKTKLSFLNAQTIYGFDEDWTDPTICVNSVCPFGGFSSFDQYERDRDETVLDVRIISETLVLGLYFQDRKTELDRNRRGDFPLSLNSDYDSERYAGYGQWTPQLSDQVQATLGARFETFSDDYNDSDLTRSDSSDDLWSLDAGLRLDLTNNSNLFVLASRGNKAGGVNTDASTNIGAIDPTFRGELQDRLRFQSESLTNVELGVNTTTLQDRMQIKASLFYNKRNNPQFETFLYDSISSFLFVGYQDNADSAESSGAELQIDWQATDGINVTGNFSFIDTSIKNLRVYDFDQFAFISINQKDQPRAASYQYHLAINSQLSEKVSATVQFEGRDGYQFAYYFNEESGNSNLMHANIQYASGPLRLSVWMRNMLDEDYPVQGLYFGNDPRDGYLNNLYTQAGEPRNIGITARYILQD